MCVILFNRQAYRNFNSSHIFLMLQNQEFYILASELDIIFTDRNINFGTYIPNLLKYGFHINSL